MMIHKLIALSVLASAPIAAAQPTEQPASASIAAAEQLFNEARSLSEKGDFAAACPRFEASYKLDAALGTLSGVLRTAPNDSGVLLAIGRVYIARAERNPEGDDDAVRHALEVIERALGGTAPRSEGLALFGRAKFLAGSYADAERYLRDAVETSPVHAEAFLYLADVAERTSHDLVARDALVNYDALKGDTSTGEARAARAARIGDLSLRAGDAAAAVEFLARAVAGGHTTPLTLGLLAQARWLTGDVASARELIARALAADPRDAQLQRISRVVR